jgi:gluconate 5-dehydrogenase
MNMSPSRRIEDMVDDTFMKTCSLQEKVVLITGGGTGIGLGIARCMVLSGATVILIGRRLEKLKEACASLGSNAYYYQFDITNWEAHEQFAEKVVETFGKLDILVNNAGNQYKASSFKVNLDDMSSTFDVHVKASFAMTRTFLPYMIDRQRGSVIFISSMAGFIGLTNQISYAAAKSAIMGLVRTFSSEVSQHGIRFNAIVPGWFETPMMLKAMGNDIKRQEHVLCRTAMHRFGQPEDIGWAAVYLGSDASKFVTGTSLVVDGGALSGF